MTHHCIPKIDILMIILKRLASGQKVTVAQLADEFHVTERSVYRYLDTLQAAGYPIYFDRKLKSYRFVESYRFQDNGSLDRLMDSLDLKLRLFRSLSLGIAVYRDDGSCVWANRALALMLNVTVKELLTRNARSIDSWSESGLRELADDALRNGGEHSRDIHLLSQDGTEMWAECIASTFISNGQRFVLVIAHDVSKRKSREMALFDVVSSIGKAPYLVMITALDGTIEYVSDKISEVTGYTRDEVLGGNPRMFKSGLTPSSVYETMWEAISAGMEWSGELCNRRKGGGTCWEHVSISPIFDADGRIVRFVAVREDVTRNKLLEEELYRHATSDLLTGLHNRRMTRELGMHEIVVARRYGFPLAMLLVDLDELKRANEEYGHQAGDEVLRAVSRLISGRVDASTIAGRVGGDEFALLLSGRDAEECIQAAELLRGRIEGLRFPWDGGRFCCTASVGIALLADGDTAYDTLLKQAREAAYRAGRRGGNRVVSHGFDAGAERSFVSLGQPAHEC